MKKQELQAAVNEVMDESFGRLDTEEQIRIAWPITEAWVTRGIEQGATKAEIFAELDAFMTAAELKVLAGVNLGQAYPSSPSSSSSSSSLPSPSSSSSSSSSSGSCRRRTVGSYRPIRRVRVEAF